MNTSMTIMLCLTLSYLGSALAQEPSTLKLPPVSLKQDKPFMQALKERKSIREFKDEMLRLQDLANLLWCANGVNRPDTKHRTVPSAMNKQDIDVFVVIHDGIYRYDAFAHTLILVRAGDYRSATGAQEFVGKAPVNLVYVSDFSKLDFASDESGNSGWQALRRGTVHRTSIFTGRWQALPSLSALRSTARRSDNFST